MAQIIIDGENHSGAKHLIQPKKIDITKNFFDAFGNFETEISARFIVSLCQKKGGWFPFSKDEIDEHSKQDFHFNRLCDYIRPKNENNYVILGEDGRYRVTHDFIAACFKSSPAQIAV